MACTKAVRIRGSVLLAPSSGSRSGLAEWKKIQAHAIHTLGRTQTRKNSGSNVLKLFAKSQNQDEKPSSDWVHDGDIVVIGGQRFQRKQGGFTNLEVSSQEIEFNVQVELASMREGVVGPQDDERFEDEEFEHDPLSDNVQASNDNEVTSKGGRSTDANAAMYTDATPDRDSNGGYMAESTGPMSWAFS
jgi:hypothetical protein